MDCLSWHFEDATFVISILQPLQEGKQLVEGGKLFAQLILAEQCLKLMEVNVKPDLQPSSALINVAARPSSN